MAKTVLLIAVEPPRAGDPMHAVRRSFQGEIAGKEVDMTDGDVVIRTGSETRRARSAELDLLQTRAAGSGPRLAVSILNRSEELTAVDTRDEQRSRWLTTERRRLLGSMDPPRSPLGNQMTDVARVAAGLESRSPDEYRREIDSYLNDAAGAWDRRLEWIAARHHLAELRLEVRNETETNFRAVELVCLSPVASPPPGMTSGTRGSSQAAPPMGRSDLVRVGACLWRSGPIGPTLWSYSFARHRIHRQL